jgi:hypothetical protein
MERPAFFRSTLLSLCSVSLATSWTHWRLPHTITDWHLQWVFIRSRRQEGTFWNVFHICRRLISWSDLLSKGNCPPLPGHNIWSGACRCVSVHSARFSQQRSYLQAPIRYANYHHDWHKNPLLLLKDSYVCNTVVTTCKCIQKAAAAFPCIIGLWKFVLT